MPWSNQVNSTKVIASNHLLKPTQSEMMMKNANKTAKKPNFHIHNGCKVRINKDLYKFSSWKCKL
jgi:hypothetical protein